MSNETHADRRQRPGAVTCFRRRAKGNVREGRPTRAYRCGRDGPGGLPKREGCQDRPQVEVWSAPPRSHMRHVAKLSHARSVITCPGDDTERNSGNARSIHSLTYQQVEECASLGYV